MKIGRVYTYEYFKRCALRKYLAVILKGKHLWKNCEGVSVALINLNYSFLWRSENVIIRIIPQ